MTDYAHRLPKGPWWVVEVPKTHKSQSIYCQGGTLSAAIAQKPEVREAIASFILEAKTAYDATGRTPAQLQTRVAELEGALAALELAANTVSACYSRNPANFASALSNLGDYAASARVLLGAST